MRHWHIIGAGNLGSFIAHCLRKHGHKVTLLMKNHMASSKYYQKIFHRLSPTSTIILLTYGLGNYEELMRDYYSLDEASRPNVIMSINSHHIYKRAKFGTQFKLVQSGFGEIDLGIIPRRFG